MISRKPNGKFYWLDMVSILKKAPIIMINENETTKCDFDLEPAVIGYTVSKDVFYCCNTHKNSLNREENTPNTCRVG